MRKIVIITIIALSCIKISAQTITGVVYDKDTKEPIHGVYVYFDGTSIGDATDISGRFSLTLKQMINTNLVFRHLAYRMLVIEDGLFIHLPDTIYLEEQFSTLSEVTVRADGFNRRQRLRAFREQFLGMTRAG
ncbi:MAG: carboxypeptidase-like regulatory domain-containing protein, partial [Firmicutes bacterium]|nr:carboxypeptidase-like regulatory domain-containing protein [Bacillota bacterium]